MQELYDVITIKQRISQHVYIIVSKNFIDT